MVLHYVLYKSSKKLCRMIDEKILFHLIFRCLSKKIYIEKYINSI